MFHPTIPKAKRTTELNIKANQIKMAGWYVDHKAATIP
jgi:hypothetical protein